MLLFEKYILIFNAFNTHDLNPLLHQSNIKCNDQLFFTITTPSHHNLQGEKNNVFMSWIEKLNLEVAN